MKIKKSDVRKWVSALRSGKYQQGIGQLQSDSGFCCLGVACDVFIPKSKRKLNHDKKHMHGGFPVQQPHAPGWLKGINMDFQSKTGFNLANINDGGIGPIKKFSFNEIADLLEAVYIYEVLK